MVVYWLSWLNFVFKNYLPYEFQILFIFVPIRPLNKNGFFTKKLTLEKIDPFMVAPFSYITQGSTHEILKLVDNVTVF